MASLELVESNFDSITCLKKVLRELLANLEKHGIDFSTAQDIWHDPDALEVPLATSDEPRFIVIGKIQGKHWSAIITYRGRRIRIISVRRSRKEEITFYEGERN